MQALYVINNILLYYIYIMNICLGSYETLFQNLKMCWRIFSLFLSLRRFFFFFGCTRTGIKPTPPALEVWS